MLNQMVGRLAAAHGKIEKPTHVQGLPVENIFLRGLETK